MEDKENIWPKKITVDKSIIKILSGSTYANFPSAIREIIINSYDADATNVTIEIDEENEIIEIYDDGRGMDENEFSLYIRIAGKSRKRESNLTLSKRRVVGQFGIGFLSVLPFCEKYEIKSTKRGSNTIVHATIPSKDYFKDDVRELDQIPIYGGIAIDNSIKNQQFTKIKLVGFSSLAKAFFQEKYRPNKKRHTVKNKKPIDLLSWELSEYLPIKYENNPELDKIFDDNSSLPFVVTLNKNPLYRNIYAETIIDMSKDVISIGKIKFKYAILANYEAIHPTEGRYLMIRNLNVGVGSRTTFDLGMDGRVFGKLAHLTGEVNVIEGMNELISVSRDKFNFSPDYENLKDFLRDKLKEKAYEFDDVQSVENLAKQVVGDKKLRNFSSIDTQGITKKIEALEKKGYKIHKTPNKADSEAHTKADFRIDRVKKEIHIPENIEDISKQISVNGTSYKLKTGAWDISLNNPALKIEENIIYVNKKYSLFRNDDQSIEFFIKLHIILLEYVNNGKMSDKLYMQLAQDIERNFK